MSEAMPEGERPLAHLNGVEALLRLARLEERHAALRETFLEYKATTEEKTTLQAEEYARRLGELNHEKDQLKVMQQTYFLAEKFFTFEKANDERMKRLESFQTKVVAYGSILLLLWGAALRFLKLP